MVIDERFDVVSRFSLPASSDSEIAETTDIILIYEPHLQHFEETSYMAAGTENLAGEDLRFCSHDEKYLLREYPGLTPGKTQIFLLGEKGVETSGIEIIIDGKSFTTGEKGLLDLSTEQLDLSSDSRIIIKGVLRN